MKKALIGLIAVLGAFGVGLAGVYYAMPTLAPDVVERAQSHLDSLAAVDSLMQAHSLGLVPDSAVVAPAQPDTLGETVQAPAVIHPAMATEEQADPPVPVQVLEDSLRVIQERIEGLLREQTTLREHVRGLQEQIREQRLHQADVQELSATLTKMEDKDLAGVVEQLDIKVLEALFMEASARNRTRLLQAMPPAVAARFVHHLVQAGTLPADDPVMPPDTVAAQAANAEPGLLNR